jgi:hypothetical protein
MMILRRPYWTRLPESYCHDHTLPPPLSLLCELPSSLPLSPLWRHHAISQRGAIEAQSNLKHFEVEINDVIFRFRHSTILAHVEAQDGQHLSPDSVPSREGNGFPWNTETHTNQACEMMTEGGGREG